MTAAAAILLAILSLWAKLWVDFAKKEEEDGYSKRVFATIGIFWIYLAIFIAMLALAMSVSKEFFSVDLSKAAEGLIIASFLMGLVNIAESIVSIWWKVHLDKTAFEATEDIKATGKSMIWYRCWFCFMTAFAILLATFSVISRYCSAWWLFGDIVVLLGILIAGYSQFKSRNVIRTNSKQLQ